MTSRVQFLFPDAQILLLMQFSEVPMLKNDFFFWAGGGGGGGGVAAFIIDWNIYVPNH